MSLDEMVNANNKGTVATFRYAKEVGAMRIVYWLDKEALRSPSIYDEFLRYPARTAM